MKRSGASAVRKGKAYETELRHHLEAALGLTIFRTSATQQIADRTRGHADLVGTPDLAIEAKRTERFNAEAALLQAIRNAAPGEIPVVISRRNRMETGNSRVLLRLDDFLVMYRAYLKDIGVLP